MVNVPGPDVVPDTIEFLNKYKIGGVILMGGNINSAQQLKKVY